MWLCLAIAAVLVITLAWESVKVIEPLRRYTMMIDVGVVKLRRKVADETHKQMPKTHKVLD